MVKSLDTVEPVPFGSYQLVERLAMGGMAEVYLARPEGQDRYVALKRILPNIAADEEFIAMFIDEAKIAGQLNHPNVAQILDLGKIDNSYFIVMEYVSGHDLRALWDRTRDAGAGGKTALPIGLACHIVKLICDGLDYAHRRRDGKGRPLGIIHRDVSPQNILVSYDGDLKIIDFGIAKAANRIVKTQTGILKGKFAYMAPEQARGEPTDHRADIFAIGVILYELLTGERAFKADTDFALLEKVRRVDLPAPRSLRPDLPKELERVVYKALSKDAADRYAWASALGGDLERFLVDQSLTSTKDDLAGFLRRSFKEELRDEQRRFVAYRAFFGGRAGPAGPDVSSSNPSRAPTRGDRPLPVRNAGLPEGDLGAGFGDSEEHEGGQGTALMEGLFSSPASAFEDGGPTIASTQGFSPAHGVRIEPRGSARAVDLGATDSAADDEIDKSEEASAVGAAVPEPAPLPPPLAAVVPPPRASTAVAGAERDDSLPETSTTNGVLQALKPRISDATQIDPDSPPVASQPSRALPTVVSRDEVPRRLRGNAGRSSSSDEREPVRVGESSAPAARVASTPSPAASSGSNSRSNPAAMAPSAIRAPLTPVLVAALLRAFIGAGVVGVWWLASIEATVTVMFVSNPRQAEVRLGDDVLCAWTPCAVLLEPGQHEIRFRAPGAQELSRVIDVKAEGAPPVDVVLERVRDDVRLETNPPGATVTLDDQPLSGTTPLTLPRLVLGADTRIKLSKDGYEPLEVIRRVDDEPIWRYELPTSSTVWTLSAEPADALIEGPGREKDGKLITTVGRKSVTVRLSRPGCAQQSVTLYATGRAEAEQKVVLDCKKANAGITIKSPRRLQVSIDNIDIPRSAGFDPYPLPAGVWTVILKGARGKTETRTVELRPNETVTLTTKLR